MSYTRDSSEDLQWDSEQQEYVPIGPELVSSVYFGGTSIANVLYGSLQVSKLYLGDNLVWESSVEPTPTESYSITITPDPITATVTITDGTRTQTGTGATTLSNISENTDITYTVEATGYNTKTGSVNIISDVNMTVALDSQYATITLITNAPNPTIVLEAAGYTQQGNSITVPVGTRVDYTISAPNYVTRQNAIYADIDKTYNIPLSLQGDCTFTIAPRPSETEVTLSCEGYDTISGTGTQSISVLFGSTVNYTITYGSRTYNETIVITNDVLLEIDMTKDHNHINLQMKASEDSSLILYGFVTIKSSEGTYKVGPIALTGTRLLVPANETLSYGAYTTDYSYTFSGTATMSSDTYATHTARINKLLNLTYSPSDINIVVKDCMGNTVPPHTESAGSNTYYMPWYGSSVSYLNNKYTITGYADGYNTETITATRQTYNADTRATLILSPINDHNGGSEE